MGGVTRLLLLLWAAVTVSSAVDLQRRILGGHPCGRGVRQYHVKIVDEFGNLVCGGSLISREWILTAAHCLYWDMRAVVHVHPGPGQTELIRAQPVIFIENNNNNVHDIMLLRLPQAIQGNVHLAQLPNNQDCGNRLNPGVQVQIAGFGPTRVDVHGMRDDNDRPAHLQCANIPVIDCPPLQGIFYQAHGNQNWICAQSPAVDIARGDSGGGVEYNGRIRGVISHMHDRDFPFRQPDVFVDVCDYRAWIRQTAGIP